MGLLAALASACSPLGAIDTLTAYDAGATKVVDGAAYGPAARQRLDVYAPEGAAAGDAADGRVPVVVFVYMTVLAYGASLVVYQVGRLLGFA